MGGGSPLLLLLLLLTARGVRRKSIGACSSLPCAVALQEAYCGWNKDGFGDLSRLPVAMAGQYVSALEAVQGTADRRDSSVRAGGNFYLVTEPQRAAAPISVHDVSVHAPVMAALSVSSYGCAADRAVAMAMTSESKRAGLESTRACHGERGAATAITCPRAAAKLNIVVFSEVTPDVITATASLLHCFTSYEIRSFCTAARALRV